MKTSMRFDKEAQNVIKTITDNPLVSRIAEECQNSPDAFTPTTTKILLILLCKRISDCISIIIT